MISDVIPNVIPPDLQHVLWVDTSIRPVIIRKKNAKLTDIDTVQAAFVRWGLARCDYPKESTMETEFKYIILRVLEHNNFPPKLVPDQWIPKETLDFHEMKCICIHVIKQLCFIEHTPTKLEFLVGNDCIKKVGFHKIHKHNNERKKVEEQRKKNEKAAKKAEEEAEDQRKNNEKKAAEEAEEQAIARQKTEDILRWMTTKKGAWYTNTYPMDIKEWYESGRVMTPSQMNTIEKIYTDRGVKKALESL
jgi:hypothetical protein